MRPGAGPGSGSPLHILGEMFNRAAGINAGINISQAETGASGVEVGAWQALLGPKG